MATPQSDRSQTAIETDDAPVAADNAEVEAVEFGYSLFDAKFAEETHASWGAIVTNPNADTWTARKVSITVTFLDGSGSVLASQAENVEMLLPEQSAAVGGTLRRDVPGLASMQIDVRAGEWQEGAGPFGGFVAEDVNVRDAGEFLRGSTVTGLVRSSFADDFEGVLLMGVLRNDEGAIIGGGGGRHLDYVAAGGSTSFELRFDAEVDGVASAEVFPTLTLGAIMRAEGRL